MLGIIGGVVIVAFLSWQLFKNKKALSEDLDRFYALSKNKVTVITVSQNWMLIQAVLLVALCGLITYVSQHPEQAGTLGSVGFMAVCAALMIVLIMNMMIMRKYQELYINKDGFHHNGKVIRFSSIRSVEPAMTKYNVETYNGQTIKISSARGKALVEVLEQRAAEQGK